MPRSWICMQLLFKQRKVCASRLSRHDRPRRAPCFASTVVHKSPFLPSNSFQNVLLLASLSVLSSLRSPTHSTMLLRGALFLYFLSLMVLGSKRSGCRASPIPAQYPLLQVEDQTRGHTLSGTCLRSRSQGAGAEPTYIKPL
jgi:hypothetical protein